MKIRFYLLRLYPLIFVRGLLFQIQIVSQPPQVNLLKNVEFLAPIPRDPKRTDG